MTAAVIGTKAVEATEVVGVVVVEVVAVEELMRAGNAGTSGAEIGIERDTMMNLGRHAVVVEVDMETGSILAHPIRVVDIIRRQVLPPHIVNPSLLHRQLNLCVFID